MKINNNQSPNFGYCKIQRSAYPVLEKLPERHITELFEQASRINKTKYWDLWLAGN